MSGSATEGLLLTVQEAAAELGLTPAQVRALVRAKRLAYVPIGRCLMIPREHLPHFVSPMHLMRPTWASFDHLVGTGE